MKPYTNFARSILCTAAALLLVNSGLIVPVQAEKDQSIYECKIYANGPDFPSNNPASPSSSESSVGGGSGGWQNCSDWVVGAAGGIAGKVLGGDAEDTAHSVLDPASDAAKDPTHYGPLNIGCEWGCLGNPKAPGDGGPGNSDSGCTSSCSPPPPPRQRPPVPAMPETWLRTFEDVTGNSTTGHLSQGRDWDQDGIPDLLDQVNLVNESLASTALTDQLTLPSGLPLAGFVLLVEPRLREAQLVAVDLRSGLNLSASLLNGSEALDLIESTHGPLLRNALSSILHDDIQVHLHTLVQDQNTTVPLTWLAGSVPVDGTWLLLRVDPTRLLHLSLANQDVTVTVPAPSHYSTSTPDYRWEFINPHRHESICYDASTASGVTDCKGTAWTGWIRSYGGVASQALEGLAAGLRQGVIPYSASVLDAAPAPATPPVPPLSDLNQYCHLYSPSYDCFPSSSAAMQTAPLPSSVEVETPPGSPLEAGAGAGLDSSPLDPPGPTDGQGLGELDVFDSQSPWQLLGDQSRRFPAGLGIDYAIPANGNNEPAIMLRSIGTPQPDEGQPEADERRFIFNSALYQTPATPSNFSYLSISIESYDENKEGQGFLLDGKELPTLFGIEPGAAVAAGIDAAHQDGFQYSMLDATGDGTPDLIFYVPHFSTAWVRVYDPNANPYWLDVEMTGLNTGWLAGAQGAVYRYTNGNLQRFQIPTIAQSQYTTDLVVLSDTEFFVIGEPGTTDTSHPTSFIAHYNSPFLENGPNPWSVYELPASTGGSALFDLWVRSDGQAGYAGGQTGLWMRMTAGSWQVLTSPVGNCDIRSLDFSSSGTGHLGVWKARPPNTNVFEPCVIDNKPTPIVYYNGNTAQRVETGTMNGISNLQVDQGFAVGRPPKSGSSYTGAGVYQKVGSTWSQVSVPNLQGLPAFVLGMDFTSGQDAWFAGWTQSGEQSCALVLRKVSTAWTTSNCFQGDLYLYDVDFADANNGLVTGYHTIFRHVVTEDQYSATVSFSDASVTSGDAVTATCSTTRIMDWFELDWGDGYQSSGNAAYQFSASHIYDRLGAQTVRCKAIGNGATASGQGTATIEHANPWNTSSYAFRACYDEGDFRHYKVPSVTLERFYTFEVQSYYPLEIFGSLDHEVFSNSNDWGRQLAAKKIGGLVPAGRDLYISVYQPSDQCHRAFNLIGETLYAEQSPEIYSLVHRGGGLVKGEAFIRDSYYDLPIWLAMEWGDGTTSTAGYNAPGSWANSAPVFYHQYAAPGTYQVTLYSEDSIGVRSATEQWTVSVTVPPVGYASGATVLSAVEAKLTGTVATVGSASVTASYKVVRSIGSYQYQLVAQSTPETFTAPGNMADFVVSNLDGGTQYFYYVQLQNSEYSRGSNWASFQTQADTTVPPVITASSLTGSLGQSVSLTVKASALDTNQVAYWILWGDGTEQRTPATGWVPWDQTVTATHRHGYAGTHPIEIRLQDQSMAKSAPLKTQAVISGSTPATLGLGTTTLDAATLTAVIGNLALVPGSDARFNYRVVGTTTWSSSPWFLDIQPGSQVQWTTPNLDRASTYQAQLELHNDEGSSWFTPTTQYLTFHTNQPPTLTPATLAKWPNYVDPVKLSVRYTDPEGDAPRNANGNPANPVIVVGGQSYALNSPPGIQNYKTGVDYYRIFQPGELLPGRMLEVRFESADQYQAVVKAGASFRVAPASLLGTDFAADPIGGSGKGLEPWYACDCSTRVTWHVVDTEAATMPSRLALGHRGKALWFGNDNRGTYEDADGARVGGSIRTPWLDMRATEKPALSFSSYYETEDLASGRDIKRVLVEATDLTAAFYQKTVTIQGYEGGYGQWRTQHIDLSEYASMFVKVTFLFDSVDGQFNNQIGWFVDDIVIGMDYDKDQFPDTLERMRQDIHVTTQGQPLDVPDGGKATSYVRRLARSQGAQYVLEGVVSHPNPNRLKVSLGADGIGSPIVLFDGTATTTCRAPASLPGTGIPLGYTNAANVVPGGLRITADLGSCWNAVKAFQTQNDWYLEVQDKVAGDAKLAGIDGLRLWVSGRTNPLTADTDGDKLNDGLEANLFRDPLGHDTDRDGINEVTDIDDRIPTWAPAMQFHSTNFKQKIEVAFGDLLSPMTPIQVYALDAAGSSTPLPLTGTGASAWRIDMSGQSVLPAAVEVRWRDAYGVTGTYNVPMVESGSDYYPKSVQTMVFFDSISAGFNQEFGGGNPVKGFFVMGTQTGMGTGVTWQQAVGIAALAVVIYGTAELLRHVDKPAVQVETTTATLILSPTVDSSGQRRTCRLDACVVYTDTQIAQIAAATGGTLTVVEITNAMINAQYRFPDAGGRTRLVWENGDKLIAIILTGHGFNLALEKAWKWQLPTAFEWEEQPLVEDFLLAERTMEQRMAETFYEATKDSLLLFRYLGPLECAIPIQVALTRTSPNLDSEPSSNLVVPKCVHDAWVYGLKTIEDSTKYFLGQGFIDMAVGQMMMQHTKQQAFEGGSEFLWYWDDDDQKANCQAASSTWANPYIRRCNAYQAGTLLDAMDWSTVSMPDPYRDNTELDLPDFVAVTEIDWAPTGNPYYRDSFAAKGIIVPAQSIITGSTNPVDHVLQELLDEVPSPEMQAADARISASYVITDVSGSQGIIDFRTV